CKSLMPTLVCLAHFLQKEISNVSSLVSLSLRAVSKNLMVFGSAMEFVPMAFKARSNSLLFSQTDAKIFLYLVKRDLLTFEALDSLLDTNQNTSDVSMVGSKVDRKWIAAVKQCRKLRKLSLGE